MMKKFVLFMAMAVIAVSANAAVMTQSTTAPIVDGDDIANFVQEREGDLDKWFCLPGEAASKVMGQTFTTDSDGSILNAITYRLGADKRAGGPKEYVIRVNTINKVDPADSTTWILTEIYSETATQSFNWNYADNLGDYGTWTFDNPLTLEANTEYGIDVGMTGGDDNWRNGIPYLRRSRVDEYAEGTRYISGTGVVPGVGDSTMQNVDGERVFHLDMSAVPEPATLALLGLGGFFLRRRS